MIQIPSWTMILIGNVYAGRYNHERMPVMLYDFACGQVKSNIKTNDLQLVSKYAAEIVFVFMLELNDILFTGNEPIEKKEFKDKALTCFLKYFGVDGEIKLVESRGCKNRIPVKYFCSAKKNFGFKMISE